MLEKTEMYYFSPTGGTQKAGELFCNGISKVVKAVDLGIKDNVIEGSESDLVVVAVPVFGGRIPSVVAEKLKGLDGTGKKAVTLVVYGNRAYEDALLELNNIVGERGFRVVASAALAAQHSLSPEVGKGRPDDQDEKAILEFAGKVLDKIASGSESVVNVPGNYPYKDGMNMPVTPMSLPSCIQCGSCQSVCPTGAIRLENGEVITSTEQCILCMACTSACAKQARILPPPFQEQLGQMLSALISVRSENEYFL